MTLRMYALVSSVVFALIAFLHLLHIFWQREVTIDGWRVPMLVSYVSLPVAGLLSLAGLRWFEIFESI